MSLFCNQCGNKLSENSVFCNNCGARVEQGTQNVNNNINYNSQNNNYNNTRFANPSYNNNQAMEFVDLADGEIKVREYLCSDLSFPRSTGILTVTNKRVIFKGKALNCEISKEVQLKNISALDTFCGRNLNILLIGLGVIFILTSIFSLNILGIALGALLIYFGTRKTFIMSIISSESKIAPINVGFMPKGFFTALSIKVLNMGSSKIDSNIIMSELGALIMELQTQGDMAIDKWKK